MPQKEYAVGGRDALGRSLPLNVPVRGKKQVGLFYFLWNGEHGDPDELEVGNVSEILLKDPKAGEKPDDPIWGRQPVFYYWGKPLFGYYLSRDKWVMSKHVEMFVQAGIDFLVFDTTNAFIYTEVVLSLLEVLEDGRQRGWNVPKIAYYTNTSAGNTAQRLYQDIYAKNRYPELWMTEDGKPLLISRAEECSDEVKRFFTIREAQWPNEPDRSGGFPWISFTRPQHLYADHAGKHRVMSVSPAQHPQILMGDSAMYGEMGNWGRSYHDGEHHITEDSVQYGYNFQEQWDAALKADPDWVFLTGWNEWTMNRFEGPKDRPVRFVDNADQEYSRDLEPMEGGHGDNYYMQMIANVRRFKGYSADPLTAAVVSSSPLDDITVWDSVPEEIVPYHPAVLRRDYRGFGTARFENDTVRRLFVGLKAAQDAAHVYFYARMDKPIGKERTGAWMQLYLGCGDDVYRVTAVTDSQAVLCRFDKGHWAQTAQTDYRVEDDHMTVAVPKEWIKSPVVSFKWADASVPFVEAADFYKFGSCAPIGRLTYVARVNL